MNLIFIISDSIREDYLGVHGCTKTKTPTVEWLARNGVYFNNVISSAPWTLPSISSYISGIYSHKLGMFDWKQEFPSDVKTLFHYFLDNGYEVGSFVFDEDNLFSNMRFAQTQGHTRNLDEILPWIDKNSSKKFFLFLHSWWTHIPYGIRETAEDWRRENRDLLLKLREGDKNSIELCKKAYIESIENISENFVGGITEKLEKEDILEDTMIIFTSDHGETWGERIVDRSEITNNFTLHGRYLYDESIMVPLILYHPGSLPSNKIINSQIRTIDVMPTVIEMFKLGGGSGEKPQEPIDGRSLTDLIFEDPEPGNKDRAAISSTTDTISEKIIKHEMVKMSIRLPPWKFIWTLTINEEELYNIKEDPNEKNNTGEQLKEVSSSLKHVLKNELNYVPADNLPQNIQERYIIWKHSKLLQQNIEQQGNK